MTWRSPVSSSSARLRCAAARGSTPADLIDWPEGLRPRSGNVTKTALLRLRVSTLREELKRRELQSEGSKEQLALQLLDAIQQQLTECNLTPLEEPQRDMRSPQLYRIPGDLCSQSLQDVWVSGEVPPDVRSEDPEALLSWLAQNTTRIQIIFLGTSSALPMPDRSLPSIALRTVSDTWLFDVGEDTQRQCLKHPLMRQGKISRIFLTSLRGDSAFGLPGMLCCIAASRDQGAAHTDQPVHVYGPPGTGDLLAKLMEITDTYLEMPVVVHEFSQKPSSMRLHHLATRAKIWKVDVPPDGLNEKGFYDAQLDSTRPLKRKLAKKGRKSAALNSVDKRAGFRPFSLPDPGNPSRYPLPDDEVCWTLMISGEFLITVREVDSGTFAYRLDEANRTGNFDLKLAASYGLLPGKEFTVLKSGGSVLTEAGVVVTPEMVLSKDRPGRCITILGGTPISHAALSPSIQNADCLITPVENDVFIGDGWRPQAMAGFAEASGVKNLILSRTRPSDREWLASEMATLVSEELTVAVAFDLYTHVMPSVKHRT